MINEYTVPGIPLLNVVNELSLAKMNCQWVGDQFLRIIRQEENVHKLAYFLAAVLIAGCGQDNDTREVVLPLQVQEAAPPSIEPVENRTTGTPAEILSHFEQDLQMCKQLIDEIKNDQAFMESFLPWEARKHRSYVSFLLESSFSDTPAAQYVVLNHQYLHLGLDFHDVPWAVAWTPKNSIYCATTFRRLKEIENLGESSEAWQIREFFLNRALSSLLHPSMEMTDGFIEFHVLENMIQEAVDLYLGPQRSTLHSWIEKATHEIEQSRADVSAESVRLTLDEQHAELDRRIGFLHRMLNQ